MRIFPRLCADPVFAKEGRAIGSKRLGGPVDDRLLRCRCLESPRFADDPACQNAPTRTAGDEQLVGIGDPERDCAIDDRHEVEIIVARIGLVDLIGEIFAITGRAPRIGGQHSVACCRVELIVGREMRAVGRERTAMYFEDEWDALAFDVIRRQGQPAFDLEPVMA